MTANQKALLLRVIILAAVVAGLAFATARYTVPVTRLISDTDRFTAYIHSFGTWSMVVYALIEALQVVIAPVPGEFVQFAGGFIFGTLWGTIYSVAGILLGSAAAFLVARLFGFPLLQVVMPADGLNKFRFLINDPKAELVMLVLFLIPGVPKDLLTYVAGLTPVKPVRFLVTTTVARFPGIVLSSFIGAHVEERRYVEVIVASSIAIGLFVVGVLFQDRIVRALKGIRHESSDRQGQA